MATKSKGNLFLYLALLCFIAIIAIFIADGYLGTYDTIYITASEYERKVEPDYWQRWANGYYVSDVIWGEPVHFRYHIENRNFSAYSTAVEVSVWEEGEKVLDVFDKNISVAAFGDITMDWAISAQQLEGLGYTNSTVKIKHGEVEREIILSFRSAKSIPPPPYPR